MKDKTFVSLAIVFFLLFIIGIGTVAFNEPIAHILRASNATPSSTTSFAIVFPQVANIDKGNNSKNSSIKVSVTVRDEKGNVMPNRKIKLSAPLTGITIKPADTQSTNDTGQAIFTLSSATAGKTELTVSELEYPEFKINKIPSIEFVE